MTSHRIAPPSQQQRNDFDSTKPEIPQTGSKTCVTMVSGNHKTQTRTWKHTHQTFSKLLLLYVIVPQTKNIYLKLPLPNLKTKMSNLPKTAKA